MIQDRCPADADPLYRQFQSLYAGDADPYGVRVRWYERRKREVLLACLPRPRFRSAYEPGCGNAELTLALAARCDALLAADFAPAALAVARTRTAALAHVRLECHRLPDDWPRAQRFDLVVLSELCYFLAPADVAELARCCAATLDADGVLVACDWRPDFSGRTCPTDAVHATLAQAGLAPLVRHAESDFRLLVWARDPRSVAEREGIR